MIEGQKFFLITSYGIAATTWLAVALNNHPDIFCAHHYTNPPKGAEEIDARVEMFAQKRKLDGRYLRETNVGNFLEEHRIVTDKPFVGNVHAFQVDTLLPRLEEEGISIPVVNLTRHPITRTASIAAHWAKHGPADPKMKELLIKWWSETEPGLQEFIDRYQVDTKIEDNRLFLLACREMFTTAKQDEYAAQHNVPQVAYEALTSDPRVIANLIGLVTQGAVSADTVYLELLFADNQRINTNRNTPLDVKKQYKQWSQWQKAAFESVFCEIGSERMHSIYNSLGYDFSVVRSIGGKSFS